MYESSSPKLKQHRLIFIDVLRGIAILWMIETHIVDACLYNNLKHGLFYYLLNISNGFVAVTFLFCAGAGFWLAAMKKGDDYRRFRKPLWIYLRRLGIILLFGYWLHLPILSFTRTFKISSEQYLRFIECNILQAIVISSLVALFILMLIRNTKILPYIFGVLALLFFFFAPTIRSMDVFKYMPDFFAAYFSKPPISSFPLFPWSGYFFAGAALTAAFYESRDKRKFSLILCISATSLILLSLIIKNINPAFLPNVDWWNASPMHSLFRTGGAALAFGLLFLIENKFSNNRFANILRLCGQESLFIYVLHLMMVYGSVMNIGLNRIVGNQLVWWKITLLVITLCSINYLFAKIWHDIKSSNAKYARYIMLIIFSGFLVIYLINP